MPKAAASFEHSPSVMALQEGILRNCTSSKVFSLLETKACCKTIPARPAKLLNSTVWCKQLLCIQIADSWRFQ